MLKKHSGNSDKILINIYSSSFIYSMIATSVVACLEIFMLIYTVINSPLYGVYLWVYRSFYCALLLAALLYIAMNFYVKKDLAHRYRWFNIANPIYVLFFFAWALGITYYDQTVTGVLDTTVFMTFSLVIPLGFYLLPRVYALIALLADAVMIYMIERASGGIGQVINTGIFIIFQLVLGVSFLLLKTQLAERIIQEEENANIDAMTGCGNRRAYSKAMEELESRMPEKLSYLAIDINGLKEVNDTYGHDAGDSLIVGAAQCIEQCFGEKGKVYRIGGDEFIVLTTEDHLEQRFPAYVASMQSWTAKHRLELSTSYGYARYADHPGITVSELAKIADHKMFQAKALYYQNSGRERRKQSIEPHE